MRVLFAAPERSWSKWAPALVAACPEMRLAQDGDPAEFDAMIYAPGGPVFDFAPFVNLRLVQSLWAGVERIVTNPTLTQPLARMVDPGLTQGMVEYCLGWTMRAHLGMDRFAQDGVWRNSMIPPLASERRVTVLGMGQLGQAVAGALARIGFQVAGFSASGRGAVDGVEVFGAEGFDAALRRAQILISLLPDTAQTRGLLDVRRLALLPADAWLINPGRGTVVDDDALIDALENGPLAHAVLDVFRAEPLPPDHPFWRQPRVTVTPHVAADTRPASAALVVADNLRRAIDGRPIRYLVDRAKGY